MTYVLQCISVDDLKVLRLWALMCKFLVSYVVPSGILLAQVRRSGFCPTEDLSV